jgi:AcrR family transcriptional regulator
VEQTRSGGVDDAVLRAASSVVAEHGWQALTLERVADAAGISRVTLHRRGVTRAALVDGITAAAVQEYRRALWPAVTGPGTGAERLLMAVEALCGLAEQARLLLGGLDHAADPVFHLDAPAGPTRAVFLAPLERILTDGQSDGSLRVDDDVSELATFVFNVVPRTYVHLRIGHAWEPQRITSRLTAFVLAATRTD